MVDPVDVPYIEADEANEDMGTERLPPLRELIWRRFVYILFVFFSFIACPIENVFKIVFLNP